jgi:cellulose biosynthesis protein BcsQ
LSEQLRTTFGEGVLNTVIEVDTKLRESTVMGIPITHAFPRSRSAIQYRALVQEMVGVNRPRSESNVDERPFAEQEQQTG